MASLRLGRGLSDVSLGRMYFVPASRFSGVGMVDMYPYTVASHIRLTGHLADVQCEQI